MKHIKKLMAYKYLHITGNLIGLMQANKQNKVSAAGYTLEYVKGIYTLTNDNGEILDQWQGLSETKFETA